MSESEKVDTAWVELEFSGHTHKIELDRLRQILIRAGWFLQPGSFSARMINEHGYRLIGPAEVAVLEACRSLDGVSVTIMENSEWKPLVALADAVEKLGQ